MIEQTAELAEMIEQTASLAEMIEQTAELVEMIERTTKIDRTEELSLFRFGFDDSACHTAMGFFTEAVSISRSVWLF